MKYCTECGTRLIKKIHPGDGIEFPYCETCGKFRYEGFNTAVSMIVTDEMTGKILLIRQYGGKDCILTAGYVNKGECAEEAAAREIKEELGLEMTSASYNRSSYFEKSNTLMLNFTCRVKDLDVKPNSEIDTYEICGSFDEAKHLIRHGSLAERFLLSWMEDTEKKNK